MRKRRGSVIADTLSVRRTAAADGRSETALLSAWRRFHTRTSPLIRWPVKLAVFGLVLAGVLWPYPALLPAWISRLRDMNSLLDPAHPGLAPLEAETRALLAPTFTAPEALEAAQYVVHTRLPYAWDWDTWGVFDYWPTVDEALRLGREDCDGRAVVAASLLRRMGYEAHLVSDLLHVWVETPQGATMNPTSTERTIVSDERGGTSVTVTAGLLRNLARGMAYGVAAFPLAREVVVLLAIVLLTLHPRLSWVRLGLGCVLLVGALGLLRAAGMGAALQSGGRDVLLSGLGAAAAPLGWLLLAIRAGGGRPHSAAGPPE